MNPTHHRQQVDTACGCGVLRCISCYGGPMASSTTAVGAAAIPDREHGLRVGRVRNPSSAGAWQAFVAYSSTWATASLTIAAEDHALRLALDAIRKAGLQTGTTRRRRQNRMELLPLPAGFWAS